MLAQECVKPFSFFYMVKPVTETKRSGVEVHKAHCHCVSSNRKSGEACDRDEVKQSRGTHGSLPLCKE